MSPGALAAEVWTFQSGFRDGGAVPDGSLTGWQDTRHLTESGYEAITGIRVSLTIGGGYNGDLYAYLAYGGETAVLLNRVGVGTVRGDAFGYDNPGLSVTFEDGSGHTDIHWYGGGGVPTGVYRPDGRAIDPLSAPAAFELAGTEAGLSSFANLDPRGAWTLFVADVVAGGGTSVVTSWGLELTGTGGPSVPEPEFTWIGGGAMAGLAIGWRAWRRRVTSGAVEGVDPRRKR